MALRKVLLTVVGHVDHGKTSLLDKIRKSSVAAGEAGGITQAIGVSIIPLDAITKICGKLLDVFKGNLTVPGLLAIDTPGHAAFTSLRKRGGSLADIAILVVDINEGFKPQTIESLEILRANKVPFIIAANKIDLIEGWQYDPGIFLLDNINVLDYKVQGLFETKLYELVAKINEFGLQAERFDRVEDYTKQIAIVPISALSGQGIPELLMVITGLAQKFLEKNLHIDEAGVGKGTILEVKEEKGLGKTLDVILYNGSLVIGDTIIVGGITEPLVSKVRILLEPGQLADMRDKKNKFTHVEEVVAATGVKIVAPGLDAAIAGMPLRSCSNPKEIDVLKQEVQREIAEVIVEESEKRGVLIRADTIGGLEALRNLLNEKKIPISSASLGDISKKDLSMLESQAQKDEFTGVLLGFNVQVSAENIQLCTAKNLKVITNTIIYKIIEDYESYIQQLKKDIELQELSQLVRPCKMIILKGYVFRQNNPAIVGVEIEAGQICSAEGIMSSEGKRITAVKSMEEGQESVSVAIQGKKVAMAMDGVSIGRQIHEGDFLYSDIPEDHFRKLKELKKYLSKNELEVLREIVEIKRRSNPVWGI